MFPFLSYFLSSFKYIAAADEWMDEEERKKAVEEINRQRDDDELIDFEGIRAEKYKQEAIIKCLKEERGLGRKS
ncbi:uncharacterized protein G2W53_020025 [Senna tora]|uniref:Uncharacterized protein n=1 Tax=Senna tora TaxID=362788 RepID=A0A834WR82_9FABA|nr:uncharacterized protein G2W53_020025 [Senna tora]